MRNQDAAECGSGVGSPLHGPTAAEVPVALEDEEEATPDDEGA